MHGAVILVFLVVALVSGYFYEWIVPQVDPHLPAAVGSNTLLRAVVTGVYIMVTIAVAFFAAKAIMGGKGTRKLAAAVTK